MSLSARASRLVEKAPGLTIAELIAACHRYFDMYGDSIEVYLYFEGNEGEAIVKSRDAIRAVSDNLVEVDIEPARPGTIPAETYHIKTFQHMYPYLIKNNARETS